MTNKEVWEHYKDYTRDITEFSRKLAFAAAGICWFFKTQENTFPTMVLWALMFLVTFFVTDILQALLAAILLRWWIRKEEKAKWRKTKSIEGDYLKPAWLDVPAFVMFLAKTVSLLATFACIGAELVSR